MATRQRFPILLILSIPIFAVLPSLAAAQCSPVIGLGPINNVTGNPFQAEVTQTTSRHESALNPTLPPLVEQVARDAQGRVRVDRPGGKFKVQNGADDGTEKVQHHITICDPVSQEFILLDTLNQTATIQKGNSSPASLHAPAAASAAPDFCSRQLRLGAHLPNSQVEDLGHRTIEGFDAHGVQQNRNFPRITNGTETTVLNVTETWCSEDLGAILLRISSTGENGSSFTRAMTNIRRDEPDASLFQIPPDYHVTERVNESVARPGSGLLGPDGSLVTTVPAAQSPATSKP
jgi:hypothetical protein